jgi:hypothetical protein
VVEVCRRLVAEGGDHERRLPITRHSCNPAAWLPNGSAMSCRPLTASDEATTPAARRLPKSARAMAGQLHRLVRQRAYQLVD